MSNNSTLLNTTDKLCSINQAIFVTVSFYAAAVTSVAAFAGNALVILLVYQVKTLRTTSNYFIVNMAISDMFFPAIDWFQFIFLVEQVAGNLSITIRTILCKFFSFFYELSYGVSMFSLAAITVDRFYVVVFPMRARKQNKRTRIKILICSWLIPTVFSSPWFFIKYFSTQKQTCHIRMSRQQMQLFFSFYTTLLFLLPLFIMLALYGVIIAKLRRQKIPGNTNSFKSLIRRRKQNIRLTTMFITIALAFILTWGSLHVLYFSVVFSLLTDLCTFVKVYYVVGLFPYVFHAANPLIYFIFCRSYRQGLKQILSCCCHHSHQAPAGDQIQLNNFPAQV